VEDESGDLGAAPRYDRAGRDTLTHSWGTDDTLLVRQAYDAAGEDTSVTQHAAPDRNQLGDVVRAFTYDALGRTITERLHGQQVLHWTWDAAGNLLVGGHDAAFATTTYDALNRPILRTAFYATSTFTYDAAGNLATAAGPYAVTARTYYPNGLVATDTQKIAATALTPVDFSQHVYALGYQYDLGGRRTALALPSQLGGGQVTSTYDPRTGQLATRTDPSGMRFRYHYDRQARLDTLVRRDGRSDAIREARTYDLASRVTRRRVWTPTATLLADTIGYDLQGRATAIGTNYGRDTVAYDALGWVSASTLTGQSSSFTLDALQNRASARLGQPHGPAIDTLRYEAGTARLLRESGAVPGGGDSTFDTYDSFGNLHEALQYQPCLANWTGGPATGWVCFRHQSTNDYDESNRMIAHQLVYDTLAQAYEQRQPVYTASETYRYDPFGRRVWYRAIKGATCYYVPSERASGCHSTLTRVIWDGPQILGEIRADGSASAPPSSLESDAPSSMGPNYGAVAYVHGLGLDAPVELIKNQADTVLPVADYRGMIVTGGLSGHRVPRQRARVPAVQRRRLWRLPLRRRPAQLVRHPPRRADRCVGVHLPPQSLS
jgi:YD repeat-containing protein